MSCAFLRGGTRGHTGAHVPFAVESLGTFGASRMPWRPRVGGQRCRGKGVEVRVWIARLYRASGGEAPTSWLRDARHGRVVRCRRLYAPQLTRHKGAPRAAVSARGSKHTHLVGTGLDRGGLPLRCGECLKTTGVSSGAYVIGRLHAASLLQRRLLIQTHLCV